MICVVVVEAWAAELEGLCSLVGGRFGRAEPRRRVAEYVSGLVAGLDRKNGWTLAERAGEVSPDGMQRLLRRADWDVDGVRDDIRDHVVGRLGDPDAVLIVDDTGFLKKGTRSAGVQRQYSGTAGRTENCQVGTFLAYRSRFGQALIDRELYLPEGWIADRERCRRAGIDDEVAFATKPRQALAMIERTVASGVPFGWVTADEAYGQVKYLRVWLEQHDVAHVLATRRNDDLITTTMGQARADELIAGLSPRAWCRISAGTGSHGLRDYDWARVPIRIRTRSRDGCPRRSRPAGSSSSGSSSTGRPGCGRGWVSACRPRSRSGRGDVVSPGPGPVADRSCRSPGTRPSRTPRTAGRSGAGSGSCASTPRPAAPGPAETAPTADPQGAAGK
ncbi:FOG: Transposase-like protein [Parafrankia sp. EAN1pec]|nr:FOG: Transposase-like protein [Frankia sp. EAN1pec]